MLSFERKSLRVFNLGVGGLVSGLEKSCTPPGNKSFQGLTPLGENE